LPVIGQVLSPALNLTFGLKYSVYQSLFPKIVLIFELCINYGAGACAVGNGNP